MFVVKPKDAAKWQEVMFMLSYYREIKIATFSDGTNIDTAYMVVSVIDDIPGFPEDGMVSENTLRLAEMHFQMNWQQVGMKCPHCKDNEPTCGHLTFNAPLGHGPLVEENDDRVDCGLRILNDLEVWNRQAEKRQSE